MDDFSFVVILVIVVIIAFAVTVPLVVASDHRDQRCTSVCYPLQVASCQSGATWCVDGKVRWRKSDEP